VFRVHLIDAERVSFLIQNGNGQTIQGPHTPGLLGVGDHTYQWNGENNKGKVAGDGTYTIVVTTTAVSGGATLHGTATATVKVEDSAPTLSGVSGSGTTFYPVVDGYQDLFQPTVHVNEGGSLWLEVFTTSGAKVKVIAQPHASVGIFQLRWDGRNLTGGMVAEGWYRYRFVAQGS
jgi:flagellar hook assembly protein FlgD